MTFLSREERDAAEIDAWRSAAAAFARSGNRSAEAETRFEMAKRLGMLGDLRSGAAESSRAAELFSDLGNEDSEAEAHLFAGGFFDELGDSVAALPHYARAAYLYREYGDELRQRLAEEGLLDALAEQARWDEALACSRRLLALVPNPDQPETKQTRLRALYHLVRGLILRGDQSEAMPLAVEAADLAASLEEPAAEVQMRLGIAIGLYQRLRTTRYEVEERTALASRAAAQYARSLALSSATRADGSPIFELGPEMEALLRTHYAFCLERISPRPYRECVAEYIRAGELYDKGQMTDEAADAYYSAAHVLSANALLEPELKHEVIKLSLRAAERYEAAKSWWGKGVAEHTAAFALRPDALGAPASASELQMLRRAVDSFARAGRLEEEANARVVLASRLTGDEDVEDFIAEALRALDTYERARRSLLVPHRRDRAQKQIMPGLLLLVNHTLQLEESRRVDPNWIELVWKVEQGLKGRAFQEVEFQNEIWRAVLSESPELHETTKRIEQLEHEDDDLRANIEAGLLAGNTTGLREKADRRDEIRDLLRRAETEQTQLLDGALERNPALLGLGGLTPPSLTDVEACLGPDEAYLGFLSSGSSFLGILVTGRGYRSVGRLPIADPAAFDEWLQYQKRGGSSSYAIEDYRATEILLAGVPDYVSTLIISPHGALIGMPWHLLPSTNRESETAGERWAIGIVPAAAPLVQWRKRDREPGASPYFGISCNGDGKIPAVDLELENIAASYFPTDFETNHLTTATCDRLFDTEVRARLLHIACHASPRGLLLTTNGVWTTPLDLLNLELKADLLLLTGCRTAAFGSEFGSDFTNEFAGIIRQLLAVTEARAAVVSTIPVADQPTALFTDLVLSALTGQVPGEPWQVPEQPLSVGGAVEWARARMRKVQSETIEVWQERAQGSRSQAHTPDNELLRDLLTEDLNGPDNDCRSWWFPWMVIGDPTLRLV